MGTVANDKNYMGQVYSMCQGGVSRVVGGTVLLMFR